MAKRNRNKTSTNRKLIYGVAGLIVLAVAAFVLINATTPCCAAENTAAVQPMSPAGYQGEFVETGAEHLLIDVRTPEEFASGHIEGAVNIPVEALASRLSEVPSGQPIVVYCRSGNRSATASQILADAGYTSIYDLGGLQGWISQGFPVS
jgi:rhodanese-related sulfurtransferase